MELPRFNDEDPFWGILNVNEFFVLHNTSPDHMVFIATPYLEGET